MTSEEYIYKNAAKKIIQYYLSLDYSVPCSISEIIKEIFGFHVPYNRFIELYGFSADKDIRELSDEELGTLSYRIAKQYLSKK